MANTLIPPRSAILIQRRARGWLDDNCPEWDRTADGKFVTRIPGLDKIIYADSVVELCQLCTRELNDPFIP